MRAFLIMPFDPDLDWLHEVIREAGNAVDVQIQRADDIFAAGVIIDQVKEGIASADAVIAVCTGRNANVFYELGIAERFHQPILVASSLEDLPFDVQHYRALLYGSEAAGQDRDSLAGRVSYALVATIEARAERLNQYLSGESVAAEAQVARSAARPELEAAVLDQGGSTRLLEVSNTGNVVLRKIEWDIPEDAHWTLLADLPEYPLRVLNPGQHVRFPLFIALGSATAATITLRAEQDGGAPYEREQLLTIYG
jgi:hypothetical protein